MRLQNVFIIGEAGTDPKDIFYEDGMISGVRRSSGLTEKETDKPIIHFDNAIAFPGLINSHDHLDFNLFPQLGNRIYNSYREWGADIHLHNKKEIQKVLAIPKSLRIKWGMYKNLLNGITTVVNHGDNLPLAEPFIDVFQNANSLHSVGFEKKWKWKLNKPAFNKFPYTIHCGEGTDLIAHQEIDELIKWNFLKKSLIAIHGVAMDPSQAKGFKALVWCPASNYFLLDRSADIALLKENTAILFGTDSTLTAGWNIWDHLRMARKTKALTDYELFNTITEKSAEVWDLQSKGKINQAYIADIVIARKKDSNTLSDSFFQVNPADILLVIKNGQIKLFDSSLYEQITTVFPESTSFFPVIVQGNKKYVTGDLPGLISSIKQFCPDMDLPYSIAPFNHRQ